MGNCDYIAAAGVGAPAYQTVDGNASPFSFDRYYGMSNARATGLGFAFSNTADWLPGVVAEAINSTP